MQEDKTAIPVLGIAVTALSQSAVLARIESYLTGGNGHVIITVNPELMVLAQQDPEYLGILNSADLCVADGAGIIAASWLLGHPIDGRTTGVDLIVPLMRLAWERNLSVYLLGGQDGVAEKTARTLQAQYPALRIVGAESGPFWHGRDDLGDPEVLNAVGRIRDSHADILLVAFGAPKQEQFISHFRKELSVRLAMGVGGAFDYISEAVPRAPLALRRMGLEWSYRLVRQPSRFKRVYRAVIVFPWLVLRYGRHTAS